MIDDVVTLDDLVRGGDLHEVARRLAGAIDGEAGAIHPDLMPPDMAWMSISTFSGREAQSYATAQVWVDGEPDPRTVYVAAWVPDLDAAIEESQRRLGHYVDRIEILKRRPEINRDAIVPEPSKLDRAMSNLPHAASATREELLLERADAEAALRERLIEQLAGKAVNADRMAMDMILAVSRPAKDPEPPPIAAAT